MQSFYPPSPRSTPTDLTSPSTGYVLRTIAVLVGLVLFVALYVGLGVAAVHLLRVLWSLRLWGTASVYALIGGSVVSVALLLFLLKGLFFRERVQKDGLFEITRAEQPRFFEFVDRLVQETGAPRPRRIYVSATVNAAVFYEPSILSLVLPTPKSLIIGLGLVNHLTLSELKAVLGHELGHFSQRTMKIGSYVYTAQRVVANLVHGRDGFDDAVAAAKRWDFRLALVAYLVDGVLVVVRSILRAAFELVALGHRALGREMELAADRMAVAVAGSDAIGRGLYKAELADACFAAAVARLVHAADQDLVTDDFFFHQSGAIAEVRKRAKRPRWGEPDDRTNGFLFTEDATSRPSMWATHPPSAERERAARALGVEAEHDERSAWILFDDAAALRARATLSVIRRHIPHASAFPKPAAEVEALLERERRATEIVERAGEIYRGRALAPLDLEAIFTGTARSRAELGTAHAALVEEAARFDARIREAKAELMLLARAQAGELRDEALVVGGFRRDVSEAGALIEQKVRALRQLDPELEALDVKIAFVHAEMASTMGAPAVGDLRAAYEDVLRYGAWLKELRSARDEIGPFLQRLSRGDRLSPVDGDKFLFRVDELRVRTGSTIAATREQPAPAFLGLADDAKLGPFLLARPITARLHSGEAPGPYIQQVLKDALEVIDKLERLHHHAIATLLHRHEETLAAWSSGAAVVTAPNREARPE